MPGVFRRTDCCVQNTILINDIPLGITKTMHPPSCCQYPPSKRFAQWRLRMFSGTVAPSLILKSSGLLIRTPNRAFRPFLQKERQMMSYDALLGKPGNFSYGLVVIKSVWTGSSQTLLKVGFLRLTCFSCAFGVSTLMSFLSFQLRAATVHLSASIKKGVRSVEALGLRTGWCYQVVFTVFARE